VKNSVSLGAAVFLLLTAALPIHFQSSQLVQGTQRRLVLLNYLLALVTREADLFTAVVTEPVCLDRQPVLRGCMYTARWSA